MKKYLPLIIRFAILVVLIIFIVLITILKANPDLCEAFMRGPGRAYALVMSKLSSIVGFSLTELAYILLFIGVIYLLVLTIKNLVKKNWLIAGHRFLDAALIVTLMFSFYTYSCEMAYNRKELPLPYYENEVLRTEHVAIYNYFADDCNDCISQLDFNDNGDVRPHVSFNEIVKEVKKSYAIIDGNDYYHSHFGNVKPMASSPLFREFQITGVDYSPLAEANINVLDTVSDWPLVIAHELAHTKGVMREDDANKLAFYICLNSDHPYLRYSAYCSYFYQLEAMTTSYYLTDEEKQDLHPIDNALYKTRRYVYDYWKKHDLLGDMADFFNNLYIKASGVEEGTSSYQGGTEYHHDPTTSKLIPSLYQKLFFDKYYRS